MTNIYRTTVPKGEAAIIRAAPRAPAQIATADECLAAATAAAEALRPQEAIALLERALELEPRNERAISALGLVLHDAGREQEAAARFVTFLDRHPDAAEARLAYAQTLLRRTHFVEAVEECRRAIAARPKWDDPYVVLIRAAVRGRGLTDAKEALSELKAFSRDTQLITMLETMIQRA